MDRLGGTFLSHAHHLIKKGPGLLSDNSKIKTQCQVFFFLNRMINLISILFVQFLVSCFQSMDYSPYRLVVLGVFFLLFFFSWVCNLRRFLFSKFRCEKNNVSTS